MIAGFQAMRRELLLAVEPSLFDGVVGSTDSEVLFYLALTFGLEDDPLGAMERAVGFVEATGREHGVEHPIQMTVGMSDGERLWAVRYSTEHQSRTLFVSEQAERCAGCTRTTRACSSSPMRIASWSPSRRATSPEPGSRSRSRPR